MITVDQKEQIRRAYYIEGKSIRQIQRETGYHRQTIRKALQDGAMPTYALKGPRPSPVMDPEATREFVRILRLHEDYPEAVIAQALETALAAHCYSVDGVKQLVLRLTEPARSVEPLKGSAITALTATPVEWPAVAQFDRLLQGRAGEASDGGAA